jgi:hypothetical protein
MAAFRRRRSIIVAGLALIFLLGLLFAVNHCAARAIAVRPIHIYVSEYKNNDRVTLENKDPKLNCIAGNENESPFDRSGIQRVLSNRTTLQRYRPKQ